MAGLLDQILSFEPISRVRRNHGLEHATLHVLARRFPKRSMAGHSDTAGFWILADVETDDLKAAVDEALQRMRAGEKELAVHPNCGTNFVTNGALAGIAGAVAMLGSGPKLRDKLERLSLATLMATVALILAQPLGYQLQANVTTSGVPGDLRVIDIQPRNASGMFGGLWTASMRAHRITTEG